MNQYKMLCLQFLLLILLCSAELDPQHTVRKPNIIFINADDLGWTDVGFQGSKFYESPNIDRLASQGMIFTNAYAPAANCAPSRASCMTGMYAPRHGIYTVGSSARGKSEDRKLIPIRNKTFLDDEYITIAEVLKAAGYVTCHVGKWHLGPDPATQGFDVNIAGCEWGSPSGGGYHSPYKYPNCEQKEKGEYLTDRLGMEAVQFIEANPDKPFFLHVATYSVHTPIQGKADLVKRYQKKDTSKAHNHPVYAAMIHSLDENVGRIMNTLEKLDLARNTLVLFTSDNGGLWKISKQWPLRAGKGAYYEGGIREPMIFRWPGKIKSGTTCDVPVNGIDLFPTFLEAAGARKPQGKVLDGLSLMPLLTGGKLSKDRALFWHFPIYLQAHARKAPLETRDPQFRTRPGSVIRYHDWKLHEYFEDGGLELYNLKDDLSEKNNRIDSEPETAERLHEMLKSWRRSLRAPVPTTLNPGYKL